MESRIGLPVPGWGLYLAYPGVKWANHRIIGGFNTQMPTYRFQTSIPAPLEQVYEHITGFTDGGPANLKALAEKHGELLEQDEEVYIFKGASEDDPTWRCTYDHPRQRVMRAHESKWADRIDIFEAADDDSTLWTVEWEPKANGFRSYIQLVGYHIRGKDHLFASVVIPVVTHFRDRTTTRHRTMSRRNRQRRQ